MTMRADPSGPPTFFVMEFGAFLDYGVWARGFAQPQCTSCHAGTLVPSSASDEDFARAVAAGGWPRAGELVDKILPHGLRSRFSASSGTRAATGVAYGRSGTVTAA